MEFLFKLFIKDKDNVTNENVRRAYGVFGGICGIILNTLLFVFKIISVQFCHFYTTSSYLSIYKQYKYETGSCYWIIIISVYSVYCCAG